MNSIEIDAVIELSFIHPARTRPRRSAVQRGSAAEAHRMLESGDPSVGLASTRILR